MSSIAFNIGPISVYWYSITMLIAILVAFTLIHFEALNFDIPSNFIVDLLFYGIIISILGARIYYVIFNWSYYSNHLTDIFKIWEGGLGIHGGIIAGLLWIIFYCKKMRVKIWRMLDIIVVGLILAQAIGRWGNFFNQEAFGDLVNKDELKGVEVLSEKQLEEQREQLSKFLIPGFIVDNMYITPAINGNAEVAGYYHPTFLYESLWCLLGFGILLLVRKLKYLKIGQLSCVYMIWYGVGRFLIEGLRTDSLMLGSIKMAQLVSMIMVVVGLILIFVFNKGSKFKSLYKDLGETVDVKRK